MLSNNPLEKSGKVFSGLKRDLQHLKLIKNCYDLKSAQDTASQERARTFIKESLGKLRGLPQKIDQFMSLGSIQESGKASSLSYDSEHIELDALPYQDFVNLLELEFQVNINQLYSSINSEPLALASLSQVHSAQTLSGDAVVIKALFPGIEKSVQQDLKRLGWMTTAFQNWKGFDFDNLKEEVVSSLSQELDYKNEQKNLLDYHKLNNSLPYLEIPKLYPRLSSEKVITLSRLDGESLSKVARTWSEDDKIELAEKLIELFFKNLLIDGFFHGDPNSENYLFEKSESIKINLLDFGCMKRVDEEFRNSLQAIIQSIVSRDYESKKNKFDYYSALQTLGFKTTFLYSVKDQLEEMVSLLFWPLTAEGPVDLTQWKLSEKISNLLGDNKWQLRSAGPAVALIFMRAYQGLVKHIECLAVEVDWQKVVSNLFNSIHSNWINADQAISQKIDCSTKEATVLNVKVEKNNKTIAQLSFPAESAHNFQDLIPDKVKANFVSWPMLAQQVEEDIKSNQLEKRILFSLDQKELKITMRLN